MSYRTIQIQQDINVSEIEAKQAPIASNISERVPGKDITNVLAQHASSNPMTIQNNPLFLKKVYI